MLLWLLLGATVAAIVLAYVTGRSIPTPIPRHFARRGREVRGGSLGLTIYRIALVGGALVAGVGALVINPTGLAAFFIAGVMVWLFMDDLQATLIDIWNANFWRAGS